MVKIKRKNSKTPVVPSNVVNNCQKDSFFTLLLIARPWILLNGHEMEPYIDDKYQVDSIFRFLFFGDQ